MRSIRLAARFGFQSLLIQGCVVCKEKKREYRDALKVSIPSYSGVCCLTMLSAVAFASFMVSIPSYSGVCCLQKITVKDSHHAAFQSLLIQGCVVWCLTLGFTRHYRRFQSLLIQGCVVWWERFDCHAAPCDGFNPFLFRGVLSGEGGIEIEGWLYKFQSLLIQGCVVWQQQWTILTITDRFNPFLFRGVLSVGNLEDQLKDEIRFQSLLIQGCVVWKLA